MITQLIVGRKPGKLLRLFIFFLLTAFLNLEMGCNYYRVRSIDRLNEELSATKLKEFQARNKYIILSSKGNRFHLTNIEINTDTQVLSADYSIVDHNHNLYFPNNESTSRYRRSRNEKVVLQEVHLIANNCERTSDTKLIIKLTDITRLDVVERDSGKTIASHVLAGVGIYIGTLAFILIIVLLTKSSCPFIYIKNGNEYVFKGELYGGAIFKPLERDDYMALSKISSDQKDFVIKISNELKERQYTDVAELLVAETDNDVNTLIDNKGIVHTISDAVLPQRAVLNGEKDVTNEVSAVDSSLCLFDNLSGKNYTNDLVLTFNKPAHATSAKLILNARNSLWLDFAFGEFTKLFGVYYNKWIEKQRTANADTLQNWSVNQNLPLSVYVKQKGEWKLVERIQTIGPLASRDICVPLHFYDDGSDKVEVKLSCGLLFWEVDYTAIDFSADASIKLQVVKPESATDENGRQCAGLLSIADNNYLQQPAPGCETTVSYKLPLMNKRKIYHVFFRAQGYYEHVRDYDGLPDKELLESFKQEGAFVNFTKHLFDKVNEANTSNMAFK